MIGSSRSASTSRSHHPTARICRSVRRARSVVRVSLDRSMKSTWARRRKPTRRSRRTASRASARILQRVDQDGRPARVIAFPAGRAHDAAPRRLRSARWGTVAAAVAASFLVGLLAEHLAHDLPGTRQSIPVQLTQTAVATTTQARASSDDEFLGQVEIAAVGVGPAALRPLDALTPRAWDAR